MSIRVWLKDTGERAGSTLVQQVVLFMIMANQAHTSNWKALVAAVIPAVGTVILNAVPALSVQPKNFAEDISLRIGRTVVVSILGAVVAQSFDLFSLSGWHAIVLTAGTMALVAVKGTVANAAAPDTITPASFATPAGFDPAPAA